MSDKKEEIAKFLGYTKNIDDLDMFNLCEEIADKLGLCMKSIQGEYYYLGREWSGIADDETGREFKVDVISKLEKVVGKQAQSANTFEEAYQN